MQPTSKAVEFFLKNDWNESQLEAAGYTKDGKPTPAILEALMASSWTPEMLISNGMAEEVKVAGQVDGSRTDQKLHLYIETRDEIDRLNKALKEQIKPLKERLDTIQSELGGALADAGQTSMKSDAGSFFFVDKTYLKVEDYAKYQSWFLNMILNRLAAKGFMAPGKNSYDALEAIQDAISLNFMTQNVRKEAVLEYQKEYGETPPGLSTETLQEVQVRRPS
jgi:hypothetical protein